MLDLVLFGSQRSCCGSLRFTGCSGQVSKEREPRMAKPPREDQRVRLEGILAQVEKLNIVERARVRVRATADGQQRRTPELVEEKKRPLRSEELMALFQRVEDTKDGASVRAQDTRRRSRRGVVDELQVLVVEMEKQHEQLHRLLGGETKPHCAAILLKGPCQSSLPEVFGHYALWRRVAARLSLNEWYLGEWADTHVPFIGVTLEHSESREARKVEGIQTFVAALIEMTPLKPVDVGWLRAAVASGFRLPIPEELIATMSHNVNEAYSAYGLPSRRRGKASGKRKRGAARA